MEIYLIVWMTWEYKNINDPEYGIISLHAIREHADQLLRRIVKIQGEDDVWWVSKDEACYKPSAVYKILTMKTDEVYEHFHLFG